MARTEDHRQDHGQAEIAAVVEAAVRALAHSTSTVPTPSDSYTVLAELHATTDHLAQVCQQLAVWHDGVLDGTHYAGEDARGDGATGTVAAAGGLRRAAAALAESTQALSAAHSANGVVRWYDTPQP